MKSQLKQLLPDRVRHWLNYLLRGSYRKYYRERGFLNSIPRHTVTEIPFRGKSIKIIDSGTVPFLIKEIFEEECYRFVTSNPQPRIIDCGANIGMGVIFFKELYPDSQIVAFEPDKHIFSALKHNVDVFGFSNVELVNKGVWNEDGIQSFAADKSATAGRIADQSDGATIHIDVTRLKTYLRETVDFLKIDIEGAETTVLLDCAEELRNVEKIFVEYHSFDGLRQELPELLSVLRESGFRIYIDSPAVISKQPFVEQEVYKSMDLMLNVCGVRMR